MFAIKVNNNRFMPKYRKGLKSKDVVLTVTTEKKAQIEVDCIQKRYPHLDLKVVEVDENIHIDGEKGTIDKFVAER